MGTWVVWQLEWPVETVGQHAHEEACACPTPIVSENVPDIDHTDRVWSGETMMWKESAFIPVQGPAGDRSLEMHRFSGSLY